MSDAEPLPEPAELHAALSSTHPLDWGDPIPTRAEIAQHYGRTAAVESLDLIRRNVPAAASATMDFVSSLPAGSVEYRLDFRIKSPQSLARKLRDLSDRDRTTARVMDVLRFTVVTERPDELVQTARDTTDALAERGWTVDSAHHSYVPSSRYKGLHANMRLPDGEPVEVQFHSRASVTVKEQTTRLYQVVRNPQQTEAARDTALKASMRLSDDLETPAGLDMLHELGGTNLTVRGYGAKVLSETAQTSASTAAPAGTRGPAHGTRARRDEISR